MTAPPPRSDAVPAVPAEPAEPPATAVPAAGGEPGEAHEIVEFWAAARAEHPSLPESPPEAWAFGATPAHADGLLALVIEGTKTATASAVQDYEAEGGPLPAVGELSIILDGAGRPRAVLEVTSIEVVPFGQVTEEHAHAEGEDDRTLESWRRIHERFWSEHSTRGFSPDMLVVCERFRVVTPGR